MPSLSPTILKRRARIPKLMYEEGFNAKEMAKKLGVHRHTVEADVRALNMKLYSKIRYTDLDNVIARELRESYHNLGNQGIESRLLAREPEHLRIQRWCIRASRVRLVVMGQRPKSIKRLQWYEARGPDGNVPWSPFSCATAWTCLSRKTSTSPSLATSCSRRRTCRCLYSCTPS